jgi:enoyl-CoA hydratase
VTGATPFVGAPLYRPAMVTYDLAEGVATIRMDDGKVNALSPTMLGAVGDALDRAESDGAAVVLAGRDGRFSAGFDLAVLNAGGGEAVDMLRGGFETSLRLLSFPRPVVLAITGHAIAMGSFLALSGDHRIGIAGGGHRIHANEVAIGMTMPRAAIEICRQRLTPAGFERAVVTAEAFTHDDAIAVGFLDRVVDGDVVAAAQEHAATLATTLTPHAHTATKLRARGPMLDALRAAIELDMAELGG